MLETLLTNGLYNQADSPLQNQLFLKILIILAGVLLLTVVGGVLIGWILEPFQKQLIKKFLPNHPRPLTGLRDGGKYIGYLERLLIFIFVLTGEFAGVGFLITAKSILRFGELKDSENRKQAEYIIIGTFASFLYAILISLAVRCLIGA